MARGAPLVFVLATPAVVVSVFIDGLGGGAIAVPLFGMAGGYALAGRGPRWVRWAAGVVALLPVPGWLIGASLIDGHVALGTPRGAWLAVLFLSLLAILAVACTIPYRAPAEFLCPRRRLVLVGVVGGSAWGAGLRGFMAAVAGPDSTVGWLGTFGIILPLSAVVIRELATPRGTWTVVLLSSHLAVLTLACAVPHRALAAGGPRVASGPGPEGRAAGAGPEAASAGTRGVNRR